MQQIPDAPWIRDAMVNGMPDYGDVPECPICHRRCKTIYMDGNDDPIGCDECITSVDVYDWIENGGYQ